MYSFRPPSRVSVRYVTTAYVVPVHLSTPISFNSHLHLRTGPPKALSVSPGCVRRELCPGLQTPVRSRPTPCTGCGGAGGGCAGSWRGAGHWVRRRPAQQREVRGLEGVQGPRVSAGTGSLLLRESRKGFQRYVDNTGRSALAGQSRVFICLLPRLVFPRWPHVSLTQLCQILEVLLATTLLQPPHPVLPEICVFDLLASIPCVFS